MKIELYHDTLAQKVFQMASTEQQMRLKIEDFIQSRFSYYQQQGVWLGQEDLNYIGPYWRDCALDTEMVDFIQKSRRKIEKESRRKSNTVIAVIGILGVLLIFSLYQLRQQKKMSLALYAVEALNKGYPSLAFRLAEASAEMGINDKNRSIIAPVLEEIDRSPLKCDMVHTDSVTAYDISDTLVAAGGRSGMVKLWNTRCQLKEFEFVHPAAVTSVRFSPNGEYLLSGAADGSVYFVHFESDHRDTLFMGSAVTHIAFTPKDPFFLIGDDSGRVRMFRIDLKMQELQDLAVKLRPPLISAEFSSGGRLLLAANQEKMIVMEVPDDPRPSTYTTSFTELAKWAHFIPNFKGDTLIKILVGFSGRVALLDKAGNENVTTGSYEYDRWLQELRRMGSTTSVHFGRQLIDSARLVMIRPDSSVVKWTLTEGKGYTFSSDAQPISAAYSSRRYLVLNLANQKLKIWNIESGKLLKNLNCRVMTSKFSTRENIFITSDGSENIHLWDMQKTIGTDSFKSMLERYRPALRELNTQELTRIIHGIF